MYKKRLTSWNKGIPNTWYNPAGLKAGWEAKKKLMENRITKVCEGTDCSNEFKVPLSLDRVKYCSQSCRGKNRIGGISANWKGGITPINFVERNKFRQTLLRVILERDNYKCQICESDKNLQVDHIQSWAEFKELRFDPDNCRTLCDRCHYKITYNREMPATLKKWGGSTQSRRIT